MYYLLSASFAFRLLDAAVGVTILMFIAWLVLFFILQPVIRLCVIQCTLTASILLFAMSLMVFPPISLQIFSAADASSQSNNVAFVGKQGPLVQVAPLQADRSSTAQEMEPPPRPMIVSEKTPSHYLQWWQFAILMYGAGTIVTVSWLLLGQWCVWRLLQQASAATGDLEKLWNSVDEELQATIGRPRKASLMVTANLTYPAAIGLWKPVILIPERYLNKPLADLKPLLAHEWSHCARYDVATRFLTSLCQVIHYYQPLFWWLRREMRVNQEYLADDAAVLCGSPPNDYAAQLLSLATQTCRDWRVAPAASILEGRSDLYRRIHMLTSPIGPLRRRARVFTWASILISFFIAPLGLSFVTLRADVARPKDRGTKQEEAKTSAPIADETIPTKDQLRKDLNAAPQDLVGIVVNQVNKPIPDVQISIWHGMHTIRTDANGRFLLRMAEVHNAFDKDRLTLDFSRDGYANHTELDWDVKFREPPLARLTNDTSIEGIVRGPNGTPAPEVLVRAGKVEKPSSPLIYSFSAGRV